MQVDVTPGTYIIAVSGGVDSVVLFDLLYGQPGIELVVAHFDHGIREDSAHDRRLVEDLALARKVPFVYAEGALGPRASEAAARAARYAFLHQARRDHHAHGIITAHHQDDLLETAILNLVRGTGRKGLSSLASTASVIRPMLDIPKSEILSYARGRGLVWREDSTNADARYLRNYIRLHLLPRLDDQARGRLRSLIRQTHELNASIDQILHDILAAQPDAGKLDRRWFTQQPHNVSKEVIAAWLRFNGLRSFDAQTLERLAITGKTYRPGATIQVAGGFAIAVSRSELALVTHER